MLKTSAKVRGAARVLLEMAAGQPGRRCPAREAVRQAGVSETQGRAQIRELRQECERLGLTPFVGWEEDRQTHELSFWMSEDGAYYWTHSS